MFCIIKAIDVASRYLKRNDSVIVSTGYYITSSQFYRMRQIFVSLFENIYPTKRTSVTKVGRNVFLSQSFFE